MKDEEIKTKYRIHEKCTFDERQIPQLKDIKFLGIRYPKKGHLILHENNVISFSSRASNPILQLLYESEKDKKKKILQFVFSSKWIENQFPNSWFTKLEIEEIERTGFYEEEYWKENYGSFGFGNCQQINSINKYYIQFKGEDQFIDYEFYDERDEVYEFEIDLYIDVAYGLDLSNSKSIIFTHSEGSEASTVYIGDKRDLEKMGIFRINWLKKDDYIEMKEKKMK